MVADKQDTNTPANVDVDAADSEQITSNYRNYLLPEANNGQGRAVRARSLDEAIAKADKLDKGEK